MLATAGVAFACGPFFPNSYLSQSTANLLAAPEGFFAAELARIGLTPPPEKAVPPGDAEKPRTTSVQTDIADVRRALAAGSLPPARAKEIGDAYETVRTKLETWVQQNEQRRQAERNSQWMPPEERQKRLAAFPVVSTPPDLTLPVGLPTEFAKYFAGAAAWHLGKLDEARGAWLAVLALPEAQRRNRSTWAAFMLGRLAAEQVAGADAEKSAAEAARFSQQARALAASGFADPLGLAAASYGWEARAALAAKNFPAAMNLYLAQHATGDRSAIESLRSAAARAATADEAQLIALTKDRIAREVVTAYFVSLAGPSWMEGSPGQLPESVKRWAAALGKAGLRDVPDADRLAWLAYEAGDFVQTKQWAALAPTNAWAAEWVRAKLALRDGNLAEGEARLRGALAALPTDGARLNARDYRNDNMFMRVGPEGTFSPADENRRRLLGELGRVCLARNEFAEALTAWIEGRAQDDASYIAERMMKTEELRAYVDAHCPPPRVGPGSNWTDWVHDGVPTPDAMNKLIRELLARRLVREEKFEQAAPYFFDDTRKIYTAYLADVRLGFDNAKPAAERAAAFWRAAQTAHKDGMNLLGTELEPDWGNVGGSYDIGPAAAKRMEAAQPSVGGVLATTSTELARLKENPVPEKRFSYRYRAADLAWWAASLLPNDSDETARILDTAGRWLAARDPEAANRFYQALVIRCGNTTLGKAAAAKHWFPPQKL